MSFDRLRTSGRHGYAVEGGLPGGDPVATLVWVEFAIGPVNEPGCADVIGQVFPEVGLPALDETADAPADRVVGVALVDFEGKDFAEGVAPDGFVFAAVRIH